MALCPIRATVFRFGLDLNCFDFPDGAALYPGYGYGFGLDLNCFDFPDGAALYPGYGYGFGLDLRARFNAEVAWIERSAIRGYFHSKSKSSSLYDLHQLSGYQPTCLNL